MAEDERRMSKKRKNGAESRDGADIARRKKRHVSPPDLSASRGDDAANIEDLESQILESQKNYNKLNDLLEYTKNHIDGGLREKAELALCTIFSHFLAEGRILLDASLPTQDNVVGRWLLKRYNQYCEVLLGSSLKRPDLALKLLMQLVKQEVSAAPSNQIWMSGLYSRIINTLLGQDAVFSVFEGFATEHVLSHRDTRMYACRIVSTFKSHSSGAIDQVIFFLSKIPIPSKDADEEDDTCLAVLPQQAKRKHPSDLAYRTAVEQAWLTTLRQTLTSTQRKRLLDLVPATIAPWFSKPELLADFLTDSFNAGGFEALTALSGMFFLIQQRNLDYPAFYTKVYSMLDAQILHSKHRPRVLRLMMVFLASTHLPAALVASFMKRLARLCLFAPPAAIIAIVPWIYNMIQEHPLCAFLIHRTHQTANNTPLKQSALLGQDPYVYAERDPMQTGALESSLWEIETLGTHYHPNVATIASIIGKPFTKHAYKVEDFLEYTYDGILNAELGKGLKKAPVVEWRIPKHVFEIDENGDVNVEDGDDDNDDNGRTGSSVQLLNRFWDFSH